MWNTIEYAPIDPRKDTTLPDPKRLANWRTEAALWITNTTREKWLQSEFGNVADFDAKTFLKAVEEALNEATYDAMKALEG